MSTQPAEQFTQPTDNDILRVEHISKRYGAVTALTDVSLRLERGEVLGLIGDNGAGKSTLIKIICGFQQPTSGQIILNGEEVTFSSVTDARARGVDVVYQDLALVNQLTVYHNMFLNREPVRWPLLRNKVMRQQAQKHLDSMGIKTLKSVDVEVASLSGGQRQAIAVARSVFSDAKVLLLDEPLAAMGVKEGAMILDIVREVKERGISVIIIAHNYGQVLQVCDRVNLLQGGKITYDKYARDTSVEELTEHGRRRVPQGTRGAPPRGRVVTIARRYRSRRSRPRHRNASGMMGDHEVHADVTPARADEDRQDRPPGQDRLGRRCRRTLVVLAASVAALAGITACTGSERVVRARAPRAARARRPPRAPAGRLDHPVAQHAALACLFRAARPGRRA